MPYKNRDRKRQWEREHREQRNAKRRIQRSVPWSGQPTAPGSTSQIAAALRNVRKPLPDPGSGQKLKTGWKEILGLAVGIGVVLVATFAGTAGFDNGSSEDK